jgi:hypothetical protein
VAYSGCRSGRMSLTCTTEPMEATDTSEPMELDAAEGAAVLTIKGRNVDAAAALGRAAIRNHA